MSKFITFITCLILIIFPFVIISNAQAKKKQHPKVESTENTTPAKTPSVEINLERNNLVSRCPFIPEDFSFCPIEREKTNVTVLANDFPTDDLTYTYIVSGGHLIGEGARVIWDLANTRPGTYTIKVIVNDGQCVYFTSEIKTITFSICGCDAPRPSCICPNLTVTSPTKSVKAGETIAFNANVSGSSQKLTSYNWYISRVPVSESQTTNQINPSEMIIEGQGTPNIKVKTNQNMAGETVIATVEISGVCPECRQPPLVSVYIEKP